MLAFKAYTDISEEKLRVKADNEKLSYITTQQTNLPTEYRSISLIPINTLI